MSKDRSISQLLASGQTIRSIEFFPPRDDAAWERFCETARELLAIEPDFVSITYGAGGSTQGRTAQAARFLKDDLNLLVMPHLTCVGATRKEIREVVDDFYNAGFRNIMALRGDPPKGETSFVPVRDGLSYGSDLVALLNESYSDICIGVAGYPEKHPEAIDFETDLKNLKTKVDRGADFVTTQLFFNNDDYFAFVDRCREIGIEVPIIPGIMPVLAYKQILRFTEMCGASLPEPLLESLEKAQDDPEQVEAIGIDWAIGQIDDLLARGAPGYHLYILNRSAPALALCNGLQNGKATQKP
ncbi:MAG TPA: methylenetetrahydrofolate reductase [NAD(P)H] [Opitutales bacterium]|nr:methylenetetrahydrofolate reductase [NAD(P)H] [Opitutales bacterium]